MKELTLLRERICPFLEYSIYAPNAYIVSREDYNKWMLSAYQREFQFLLYTYTTLTSSKLSRVILSQVSDVESFDLENVIKTAKQLPRLPKFLKSAMQIGSRPTHIYMRNLDFANGNDFYGCKMQNSFCPNASNENEGVLQLFSIENELPDGSFSLASLHVPDDIYLSTEYSDSFYYNYNMAEKFIFDTSLVGLTLFPNENDLPHAVRLFGNIHYVDEQGQSKEISVYDTVLPYFHKDELPRVELVPLPNTTLSPSNITFHDIAVFDSFENKANETLSPKNPITSFSQPMRGEPHLYFKDGKLPTLLTLEDACIQPPYEYDTIREIKRIYENGLIEGQLEFHEHPLIRNHWIGVKSGELNLTSLGEEALSNLEHPIYCTEQREKQRKLYFKMLQDSGMNSIQTY